MNIAYESGIKLKYSLICDLIAGEWQKSYEITRIKVYCGKKENLRTQPLYQWLRTEMVRAAGLEPTVSWSQTKRDTKLR